MEQQRGAACVTGMIAAGKATEEVTTSEDAAASEAAAGSAKEWMTMTLEDVLVSGDDAEKWNGYLLSYLTGGEIKLLSPRHIYSFCSRTMTKKIIMSNDLALFVF